MDKETYASAGVNISQAEKFVERLKGKSRRPEHQKMWQAAGGYAAVYPFTPDRGIAITTDGVGTKLLISHKLNRHHTIGIDLVAMCVNDLICVGARPTLFLDYFAIGKLDDKIADDIITGIVEGCDQAGVMLVGGETAEMPGVYEEGHYDLAGFAVGDVAKDRLLTGERIAPGQKLIGVASNGIHSNGLSLARKVLPDDDATWENLLRPTTIYVKPVVSLLEKYPDAITGIANITGGGWRNLFRLNSSVGYRIDNSLPPPDLFRRIGEHVSECDMYSTFNMGMGLCLMVNSHHDEITEFLKESGHRAQVVGTVTGEPEVLTLEGTSIVLKG